MSTTNAAALRSRRHAAIRRLAHRELTRPEALEALRLQAATPRAVEPAARAWLVLFTCLAASAGHGLFLWVAVTRHGILPPLRDLGGPLAPAVAWFLAAPGAALAALLLRGPLARLGRVAGASLAVATTLATAAAFAAVLVKVAAA